jgi:hypothetical protein
MTKKELADIHNQMMQVPGVVDCIVEVIVITHVRTVVNTESFEQHSKVYDVQSALYNQYPDAHFDFSLDVKEAK